MLLSLCVSYLGTNIIVLIVHSLHYFTVILLRLSLIHTVFSKGHGRGAAWTNLTWAELLVLLHLLWLLIWDLMVHVKLLRRLMLVLLGMLPAHCIIILRDVHLLLLTKDYWIHHVVNLLLQLLCMLMLSWGICRRWARLLLLIVILRNRRCDRLLR